MAICRTGFHEYTSSGVLSLDAARTFAMPLGDLADADRALCVRSLTSSERSIAAQSVDIDNTRSSQKPADWPD